MAVRGQDREAAYQVLARELRAAILRGEYAEDVRLPTEAELSERHGVSRQTVRRAFQDLVAEGMVHRVPGRGTFATPRAGRYLRQVGSVEDLLSLALDTALDVVRPLRRRVDIEAAGRLHLDTDAVHEITFRRLHGGIPFCLTTVWLPPSIGHPLTSVPALATTGSGSSFTIIGLIEERLRITVAEADQSITAVPATVEVAGHLGCHPGDPLLRVDRLYCTDDSAPVEVSTSHFLPEHYTYRVRLRRGTG